jgi:hypothetical protein
LPIESDNPSGKMMTIHSVHACQMKPPRPQIVALESIALLLAEKRGKRVSASKIPAIAYKKKIVI